MHEMRYFIYKMKIFITTDPYSLVMRIQPKATEFHSVAILFYKLDVIYIVTLFGKNLGIFLTSILHSFWCLPFTKSFDCQRRIPKSLNFRRRLFTTHACGQPQDAPRWGARDRRGCDDGVVSWFTWRQTGRPSHNFGLKFTEFIDFNPMTKKHK